ncbi:protein FAM169B isoform X3 [Leucoraja erinacea]|uniref:protein FAM169B isoform X3 n=1 Tax=Leucoraja erinaceus TaxID=7782 RepID=UPI0024551631|nr:protein FAM169B isoform X3 [Leucoraja erinacea]
MEATAAAAESCSLVDILTDGDWDRLTRPTEDYLSRLSEESTEVFRLTNGEQLAITPSSVAFLNLFEDHVEQRILALLNPQDRKTVVAVYVGQGWCSLDQALRTSKPGRQELVQVRSVGERIVLYLLNRVICGSSELPVDILPFRDHPVDEFAKIFWKDQEAAGFYTVKMKVCHRYLQSRPEDQNRLWEVEAPGDWSQRQNVWLLIQMGDIPSAEQNATDSHPGELVMQKQSFENKSLQAINRINVR